MVVVKRIRIVARRHKQARGDPAAVAVLRRHAAEVALRLGDADAVAEDSLRGQLGTGVRLRVEVGDVLRDDAQLDSALTRR